MLWASASLLLGVVLAAVGGDVFVRGVLGFARWARIPSPIAAATLGAFATSSPELFVSSIAALDGNPLIGLGDSTGSNVVNIALVLALALLIKPLRVDKAGMRLDFLTALGASVALGLMAIDGQISRIDGWLLLGGFGVWLSLQLRSALRERGVAAVVNDARGLRVLVDCVAGLVLLVLAGYLIVKGAEQIVAGFGVSAYVIGATLIALGTSMPELATTIVAQLKGHEDVSIGTLLGSNVFNGLAIVGITGVIHPIPITGYGLSIALIATVLALLLVRPGGIKTLLGWRRGLALLCVYITYISVLAWM